MSKHMTEGECRLREVECPLGCGAKLVLERREGHMAERCPYRTTKCAQVCPATAAPKQRAGG